MTSKKHSKQSPKPSANLLQKVLGGVRRFMGDTSALAFASAEATTLYQLAVEAARTPTLYQAKGGGVADTLDGRFDATTLMVVLVVWRLHQIKNPEQQAIAHQLAQNLVDTMFADMEASLLTMGVGENTIGKRMRALASAFGGRMQVYRAALDGKNQAELASALSRNLYRTATTHTNTNAKPKLHPHATALAKQILALTATMGEVADSAWLGGKLKWAMLAKRAKIGYSQFGL